MSDGKMSGAPDLDAFRGELPRTEGVVALSPAEAYELTLRGATIVDLRETYETNFRVFAVERVVYLPWSAFEAGRAELPAGEALIFADAAGLYGRLAAQRLRAAGMTNAANLAGGMIDWDRDGLPVRKDPSLELSGQCACKLKTGKSSRPPDFRDNGRRSLSGGMK